MTLFIPENIEVDLLKDLAIDYQDLYQSAEDRILKLELAPENTESLNDLFRTIHTIKGNAGFLGLQPLVNLLQELESILHLVRVGELPFQALIGDLTLLVLDKCSQFIDELSQNYQADYDSDLFKSVKHCIRDSLNAEPTQRIEFLAKALAILDPTTIQPEKLSYAEEILRQHDISPTDDLIFIVQLAEQTQGRAAFWDGRLERILNWIMALNKQIAAPIEAEQLLVAVCLHDVGMAMLPSHVINKQQSLTKDELKSIQDHVWVASRLVSSFPNWKIAKTIIDHHQENYDGSGYPLGLKGQEIAEGAQMLAIVHAFEAITHGYSKSLSQKRPLMRAIMELNRFAGAQFNPTLVTNFMEVARAK